jgi:membrane protein implicated in regulation of membrane protease activity
MNIALLWLIAGSLLCLMELLFPVAFVAMMMGLSAVLVGAVAGLVPSLGFPLQIFLWILLSTLFVILSRRFVPKRSQHPQLRDDSEGEVLSAILPGEGGRVLYEGNSWRAECQDPQLEIPERQKVYIVGRKGNTLIVLPLQVLRGDL